MREKLGDLRVLLGKRGDFYLIRRNVRFINGLCDIGIIYRYGLLFFENFFKNIGIVIYNMFRILKFNYLDLNWSL